MPFALRAFSWREVSTILMWLTVGLAVELFSVAPKDRKYKNYMAGRTATLEAFGIELSRPNPDALFIGFLVLMLVVFMGLFRDLPKAPSRDSQLQTSWKRIGLVLLVDLTALLILMAAILK